MWFTGNKSAVNPERKGTKCAANYALTIKGGQSATIRLRLSDLAPAAIGASLPAFW